MLLIAVMTYYGSKLALRLVKSHDEVRILFNKTPLLRH